MTTVSRNTKQCKIDRTIDLALDNEPWGPTLYATVVEDKQLKTKTRREVDVYILEAIKCDIGGRAFLVTKQDGSKNHVHIDQLIGDSCTCAGNTLGNYVCRHIEIVHLAIMTQRI